MYVSIKSCLVATQIVSDNTISCVPELNHV